MDNKGKKFDGDKPRTDLLSPTALLEIAKVMGHGAKKYDAHNWRKGIEWSRLLGAAMRHLLAFMDGQDKDPETGFSHLAHLGCCVMFLLEYEKSHKELDDRYRAVKPSIWPQPQYMSNDQIRRVAEDKAQLEKVRSELSAAMSAELNDRYLEACIYPVPTETCDCYGCEIRRELDKSKSGAV